MKVPDTLGTERKTDRLEAFSDAVLAIAITLPIVDMHAPDVSAGGDLAAAYSKLGPEYVAYGLSVVVIGSYWVYSHFSGKIFRKTDHGFNVLTVAFLALVSVTPFPSRPFIEHLADAVNVHTAASVYAGILAAPSVLWGLRWFYALRRGLLDPHLDLRWLRSATLRYAASTSVSVIGALLTWFVSWQVGLAMLWIVVLSFLVPPMAPTFKAGEEPEDDLQEADERPA